MTKMREQAEDFGARFVTDEATELKLSEEPGGVHEAVGFVPSAANAVLPPLLRRFAAAYPGVDLHLREMAPDELVRSLHEGRLDVCFLYLPFEDALLDRTVVARERFVAALPDDPARRAGARGGR